MNLDFHKSPVNKPGYDIFGTCVLNGYATIPDAVKVLPSSTPRLFHKIALNPYIINFTAPHVIMRSCMRMGIHLRRRELRQLCLTLICCLALTTLHAQETDDLIHTVDAGETLISIANAYGVTLDQLLTLNNLDPDAYLQIGQRLLVIPDAVQVDDEEREETTEAESDEATTGAITAVGTVGAPVIEASAPMMDPADLSPHICFVIFADENHNGMREPEEPRLGEGEIMLFDAADLEQLHYTTDGESEPYCVRDLGRRLYRLEAAAPAGYGLSSAASLWLDLRAGGKVELEFGARPGLPPITSSALEPGAEIETAFDDDSPGLLRELSGLVLVALAGMVFASGMIVAVFLRSR